MLPVKYISYFLAKKKGSRSLAKNHRPVSLTCITCKLFEHIVCRHILDHVSDSDI